MSLIMRTVAWIAFWKTHGRFMDLAQNFWEWIFCKKHGISWENVLCTCIQASERQLCGVWRHGLIARSHSGVSLSFPCLHINQTAFSLVRFRLPKAVPEQAHVDTYIFEWDLQAYVTEWSFQQKLFTWPSYDTLANEHFILGQTIM